MISSILSQFSSSLLFVKIKIDRPFVPEYCAISLAVERVVDDRQ